MRSFALACTLFSGCFLGCGEPSVPKSAPQRTAKLVQTVPTETSLEAHGIAHTHAVWRDLIANAQRSVDAASFYVSNHEGGRLEPVLAEMERAAQRGVAVRLLVDDVFAEKYPAEIERLSATLKVRRLDLQSRTGGVQHAKYLVVDGERLYLGSANFDWRALEHIHEMGVLVESVELAGALASLFQLDWDGAPGASGDAWPSVEIGGERWSLVASPKGLLPAPGAWDLPRLTALIHDARKNIDVQLLSYDAAYRDGSPWKEIHAALLAAAGRGVRVRVALSHWQKKDMAAVKELQRADGIDVVLVELPPHSSGFIPFARVVHAKYMVVDEDVAWIGTSNWKGDYFYASRNVGVVVRGASTATELHAVFASVFGGTYATPVDPEASYEPARVGYHDR